MRYSTQQLILDLEARTADPVERISLASAERKRMLAVTDEATDHFVSAARASNIAWATILAIVDRDEPPSDDPPDATVVNGFARDHNGKYRPLWKWLCEQSDDEIDLTFTEVEQILGFPLPPSSRDHHPHWHGYKGSAVARAIIDAGFKSKNTNLQEETVTLVRTQR